MALSSSAWSGSEKMSLLPKNILFATDGSEDALLAGRAAVDLAKATGTELHVLHAWHPIPPYIHPSVRHEFDQGPYERNARELFAEQRARIKGMGGEIGGEHLRTGPPADEILEAAQELEAGLIVVGSRGLGRAERLAVGSVSEEVAHYAPCPVLVARGGEKAWPPSRIVVGEDASEGARKAGELATGIGKVLGAGVLLVRAYREFPQSIPFENAPHAAPHAATSEAFLRARRNLEARAQELYEQLDLRPQTRMEVADPTALILEAARERPTLIAVGSRGLGVVGHIRKGSTRRLGSVSTKVLRAAGAPVLLCREG